MKILVAIDSFKGSLSTFQANSAISDAAKRVFSDVEVISCPLADGGEGTVDAIVSACGGEIHTISVTGPLGEKVNAKYGAIPKTKTAIIEMAEAAGITLIPPEKRNPMRTTTFGVGELIKDAIEKGYRSFIVAIGGSATNDGGIGMLQALGFSFLDKAGNEVAFGAEGLSQIDKIITDNALPELQKCNFCVACDVKNPLCGPNGCSYIFAPQKGGTPQMIEKMDRDMKRFADLSKTVCKNADETAAGSGAAGGLGFALLSYLDAKMQSGISLVIEQTNIEEKIKNVDLVVTGEGRLDHQSAMGKAPIGIASLAKKYGKKVIAFAGCVTDNAVVCNECGIDAFFPILRTPCSLAEAMDTDNAIKNMTATAEQVFLLIKTIEK